MLLPETFTFTQQKLQDYVDCKRRFFLRHITNLEWPAIESEPIREQEELIQLGTRFHLLCQQAFAGVPIESLSLTAESPELAVWWQNFLVLEFFSTPRDYAAEKMVSIPFAGFRLAAKYDLLFNEPSGKIIIYDWKTSQHQPKRQTLLERMQSMVYPLVAGKGESVEIEMVYWYPSFPETPIRFTSTPAQRAVDATFLESLVVECTEMNEDDFVKTNQERKCQFCRYRSLCDRGITAGKASSTDALDFSDAAFDFDFDAL